MAYKTQIRYKKRHSAYNVEYTFGQGLRSKARAAMWDLLENRGLRAPQEWPLSRSSLSRRGRPSTKPFRYPPV